jgi:hypothetical protein
MSRKKQKPDSQEVVLHVAFVEALFHKNLATLTQKPSSERDGLKMSDPAFFVYQTTNGKLVAGNVMDKIEPVTNTTFVKATAKHFGNTKVHHNKITKNRYGRITKVERVPKYQAIDTPAVVSIVGFVSYEQALADKLLSRKTIEAALDNSMSFVSQDRKGQGRHNALSIMSRVAALDEDDLDMRRAVNSDLSDIVRKMEYPSKKLKVS